ncbi:DUF5693 family protein [Desulforamulus aeronauticus]|uniref:Uncharacterized protein n=1 Tax=Desulforamulus aeronauticus DSM 10349 TaxID=1121421 RepID=A0A1M6V8B5_9FIRM|nr:DUF5693 family protein [Desulforamulus aeronauticus]SHK77732.1 hypothetical protein SAMN02745123_03106 [Desulforamulus aeronauticus DSM 10349]
MDKRLKYGLWAMIIVAVLAAAHVAFWQRYMVEKDFRQVELAVNYDEIRALSGLAGLSPVEGLQEFKKHGVTAVVLREPLLEDLAAGGRIEVFTGQALLDRMASQPIASPPAIVKEHTYILIYSQDLYQQIFTHMSAKLTGVKGHEIGAATYIIETTAPYIESKESIKKWLGVGFTQASLDDVVQAGLKPIPQIRTWPADQKNIRQVFALYRNIPGVNTVLFNDDTLPGYNSKYLLAEVANELKKSDVALAQVEFFNQQGFNKLGILLDKRVVRLHTISPDELKKMTSAEALDRYALAAAERNQRILYYRPSLAGGGLLQQNLEFLDSLGDKLEGEGLTLGSASQLPPVPVSRGLVFLTGLGVIAGGLLFLGKLRWHPLLLALGAVAVLLWLGLLWFDFMLARKLMALAAVVVFPTLSLLVFLRQEGRSVGQAILVFVKLSLFSLLGALFMVGLMADAGFMLKLDQFIGVKLAHVLPLMILLLYFSLLVAKGLGVPEKIRGLLNQPIVLGIALMGSLMAVAVAIYVLRTGNEGMTVSGLELQFRSLLDQILGVRPRTKEFLLGHPALLLLLLYGYRNNRFLPLLLLAAIGQASLVNTFAHIHTPLVISLLRAGHGIWLGILLGLVVYYLIKLAAGWGRRVQNG